jgi:hypothetical protein
MPYIKQEDRKKFDPGIERLAIPETEGDLNYVLTRICHRYLKAVGINYKNYNSVIGVLECAKLELYRQHVGVYENLKIAQNGDVK